MIVKILLLAVFAFLVFFNLTSFPKPWFDEGSHLHVPKTLVRFGVYADISSEGFRYYGPTIGVGPTVMLPIAAVFKIFGIGLFQARAVIALYSLGAIFAFLWMVRKLSNNWIAFLALILMLSSRSVLFLEYGRQVLGEIPGFFFLVLGIGLWFQKWKEQSWQRLVWIGLLFGLAMITKYQYLLFLAPMMGVSWIANIFYYRTVRHRDFLIPGIVAAASFGIWQVITIFYLGPSTALENFALLRVSAEGAAFSFNLSQIGSNLELLSTRSVYMGALLPAILFGFFIAIPRNEKGQKWGMLFLLAAFNLVWFVIGSIGWIRYAFLGLAVSSIFIARFFYDLTNGFQLGLDKFSVKQFFTSLFDVRNAFRWALTGWLALIILIPLAKTLSDIVRPQPNGSQEMAAYLNANVPLTAEIETWDPEMGFFTNHNYHYPPNPLLARAVQQIYSNGAPVNDSYNYVQTNHPQYILAGVFSQWVNLYPEDQLSKQYELVTTIKDYKLYKLR